MRLASRLNGGAEEDRTPDPLRARQVLSQLSYDPIVESLNCYLMKKQTVRAPYGI